MTGKRQHYIPRLLLRGFASSAKGRFPQTIVHHKDRRLFRVPVEGIGVESYFYSSGDVSSDPVDVDQKITEYEQEIAPIINDYRSTLVNVTVERNIAAEIAVHFAIRTNHIRRSFASTTEDIAIDLERRLTSPAFVRKYLKVDDPSPSKILRDQIRDGIRQEKSRRGLARIDQGAFEREALRLVRQDFEKMWLQQSPMLSHLFHHIREKTSKIVQISHNRALAKSLSPEARKRSLINFSWSIFIQQENSVLLSDGIALALTKSGKRLPLFFTDDDDVVAVEVPISHDRILVGYSSDYGRDYVPATPDEVAGCSWDYFVSRSEIKNVDELLNKIGGTITDHLDDIRTQLAI